MKNILFIAFVFVFATNLSLAEGWEKFDSWGTSSEIAAKNKELRLRAEQDERIKSEIRKNEEAVAPRRAADERWRKENGITVPSSPASSPENLFSPSNENMAMSKEDLFRSEIKAMAYDPDSVIFKEIIVLSNGRVCGLVNAKNRFGGYVGFESMCTGGPRPGSRPTWSN